MLTRLTLPGVRAIHAVRAVRTALTAVDGITHADVSRGRATIEHDGRATVEALREALAVAGYEIADAIEERRRLPITD